MGNAYYNYMSVINHKEVIEKGWEIIIIVIIHKYGNLHLIYLRNIKNVIAIMH